MVSWNFAFRKGLLHILLEYRLGLVGGIIAQAASRDLLSIALVDPSSIALGGSITGLFLIVFPHDSYL